MGGGSIPFGSEGHEFHKQLCVQPAHINPKVISPQCHALAMCAKRNTEPCRLSWAVKCAAESEFKVRHDPAALLLYQPSILMWKHESLPFWQVGFDSLFWWMGVELHDILHVIVMCISSVKTVLWLAVNLHHLFSNGAAFNTQSCSSLTSYTIRAQNRRWIACDSECDIA